LVGKTSRLSDERVAADIGRPSEQFRHTLARGLEMRRFKVLIKRGVVLPLFHKTEIGRVGVVLVKFVRDAAGFCPRGCNQAEQEGASVFDLIGTRGEKGNDG